MDCGKPLRLFFGNWEQKSIKIVTMKYENTEVIHLRMPTVLAQFINRASFQTGISKQEIIRQIVRKHFSDSQGYDIVLEHHKKTIEQNIK